MTLQHFRKVLFMALFFTTCFLSKAVVVYQYGFENLVHVDSTTPSPWTGTPDVLATGLSSSSWATNYTAGLFICYGGSCGTTACKALSISHNNYPSSTTFTLTFTINPGYSLSVTDLSFWNRESGTGPTTANITINGTAAVSSLALAGTTGANTGVLTPTSSFTNLTGTFTLVMTLTGATGTAGTFRLDDFVIDGTVTSTSGINAYAVTGGGRFCAGDSGVHIGLAASDTGISYQLKNGTNNVGTALSGTGAALDFGLQTVAGTYTILATNHAAATNTMTGTAVVIIDTLPVVTLPVTAPQCGGFVSLDAGNAGSTYVWSDATTSESDVAVSTGTYKVTVTNSHGCSATASASVTINTPPSLSFSITSANICAGSPTTISASGATSYVWSNGATTTDITVSPVSNATYNVTGTDGNNCTATGVSSVNVSPAITSNVTTQICLGLAYYGHTTSGTFIDTISTGSGCDSIRTLNLTVTTTAPTVTSQTICAGQSYNGHTVAGNYSDTLHAAGGCDSIVSLTLTVTSLAPTNSSQTICSGQSYNGHSVQGIYNDTIVTSGGCDSINVLNLTVLPAITGGSGTQTICNGTSYHGHTVSGTFTDTLSAAGGCDSLVTLILTVLPQPSTAFSRSICQRDTFMGHTTAGLYTDTLTAASGCDSIVYLNLTVNALPHVTLYLTFDTVCSNAPAIVMSGGSPAGGWYTGQGIVNDSIFNPAIAPVGKDTIYYNFIDSNGCYKNRYEFAHTEICEGIDEAASASFRVMPNPAQDVLVIENTAVSGNSTITLYDLLGRSLISREINDMAVAGKTTLNLHDLPSGVYMLQISENGRRLYSGKIVKE